MGRKLFEIVVILTFLLHGSAAPADAGYPVEPKKEAHKEITLDEPEKKHKEVYAEPGPEEFSPAEPSVGQEQGQFADIEIARKVFSLGRGVGASYYHFVDLSDKSRNTGFKEVQQEYNDTFQTLNIIDIILDDLKIKGKSRDDLNKIRLNFYDALQNQDLSETKLAFARDMFVVFYENLSKDLANTYSARESWLSSLGFYTSFQLESLNSQRDEKILISGFDNIMSKRPVVVPQEVYDELAGIYRLDKPYITESDLESLEENLVSVVEYFTNYPDPQPLFNEVNDLAGVWQGILFNPDNEKYDIRLSVKDDLSATMDIDEIAYDVMISDIRVVNNYFTFMFKPFGTEKFYLKFNAKLTNEIFSGEITDVLGEKGHWVLAKTDSPGELKKETVRKMASYIQKIEKGLEKAKEKQILPVEKQETPKSEPQTTLPERETTILPVNNKTTTKDKPQEPEIIIMEGKKSLMHAEQTPQTPEKSKEIKEKPPAREVIIRDEIKPVNEDKHPDIKVKQAKEAQTEEEYYTEEKSIIKKLKSFFGKLFSFIKFL